MEYPKALYLQGECRVVADFAEDEVAQAAGFTDWATDHERGSAPAQQPELPPGLPESPPPDQAAADAAPVVTAKRAYNRKAKGG